MPPKKPPHKKHKKKPKPPHGLEHKPVPPHKKHPKDIICVEEPRICGFAHGEMERIKKQAKQKRLLKSILFGCIVTLVISLVLLYYSISINVVLPVAAPILVGSISLFYNVLGDKHK